MILKVTRSNIISRTVESAKVPGDVIYYAVARENDTHTCTGLQGKGKLEKLNWGENKESGVYDTGDKIVACLYNEKTFSGNEGNFAKEHCSIKVKYSMGSYKTARVE